MTAKDYAEQKARDKFVFDTIGDLTVPERWLHLERYIAPMNTSPHLARILGEEIVARWGSFEAFMPVYEAEHASYVRTQNAIHQALLGVNAPLKSRARPTQRTTAKKRTR